MKFKTLQEAESKGLMQLFEWLTDSDEEREFIKRECDRINAKANRIAIPVENFNRISLFVDRVAGD